MPSRDEIHYFGAGPAPLPTAVLEEASRALLNYQDGGIGLAEISHRSAEAHEVLAQTRQALRQLLDIPEADGPEGYQILFLQGGGSGQFSAVVYNLVSVWVAKQLEAVGGDEGRLAEVVQTRLKLDYLVTGSWSLKASQEAARLVGAEHVNIVSDSRQHGGDGGFGGIAAPASWRASGADDAAFTYYCDNETVDGVEFAWTPPGANLVADMSSNLLSRAVAVRRHAAIFAGAQKNVGAAGVTMAIVSNAFLPPHAAYAPPDVLRRLGLPVGPAVLDWPTVARHNSLYNTLAIFDVWIAGRVMRRLLDIHPPAAGEPRISGQAREAERKAQLLYSALDRHGSVYRVVPHASVRSRMNICFRVKDGDAEAEKAFLTGAEARGLMGLKGHRSVGGIRISNYNAVPVPAAEKLAQYLDEYARAQTGSVSCGL